MPPDIVSVDFELGKFAQGVILITRCVCTRCKRELKRERAGPHKRSSVLEKQKNFFNSSDYLIKHRQDWVLGPEYSSGEKVGPQTPGEMLLVQRSDLRPQLDILGVIFCTVPIHNNSFQRP